MEIVILYGLRSWNRNSSGHRGWLDDFCAINEPAHVVIADFVLKSKSTLRVLLMSETGRKRDLSILDSSTCNHKS